jgi:predicted transglutaminase-like cysteine proteinase
MGYVRTLLRVPLHAYLWYASALALAMALLLAFGAGASAKDARLRGDVAAASAPQARRPPEPEARTDVRPPAPGPARFFTINEILNKRDNDPAGTGGRTAAVEATATDAGPAARRGAPGPEPFGLYSFRAPDGLLWSKWRGLESDLAMEATEIAQCRDRKICGEAASRYLAILDETRAKAGRAQLETANRLVNRAIRYVSDQEQHGLSDRWQAPLAALSAGRGDCEEYAIAKYQLLRESGVGAADLRLVLVRDTAIRIDHAVLAARFEGRWLVLDNRRGQVAETEDLRHYMPLYALDAEGVKLFAAPYAMWGEGAAEFAAWTLRGTEGEEYAAWSLRGSDAEPAGAEY